MAFKATEGDEGDSLSRGSVYKRREPETESRGILPFREWWSMRKSWHKDL